MVKNTETLNEQRAWWRLEAMGAPTSHYQRANHFLFYAQMPSVKDPKV